MSTLREMAAEKPIFGS